MHTIHVKRILLLFFAMLLSISSFSQTKLSVVDSIRQSFDAYAKRSRDDFNKYHDKLMEEYNEYLKVAHAEFEAYKQSISRVWGADDVLTGTQTKWVEYSDDFEKRSVVDFEEGTVTVEVAVELENFTDSTVVNELMAEAVADLLESRGSTCPYDSEVDDSEPLTEEPILDGVVDLSPYSIHDPSEYEMQSKSETEVVAEAITAQSPKYVARTVGDDGEDRVVVQLDFNLVADNLSKNAMLYRDYVEEFSRKFNVEQPLIYAVIEQESYFNPEAVSPAKAYGLMQLVATSGGRDAYNYVYGKDWIPSRSYLFNPRNNIELGTAYLRILMNQFKNVSNPDCRRLCAIAGYNTGAGNVSRSFTGNVSVQGAVGHINNYSYNQLYSHLTTRLSTSEARNYVAGVTRRREKYLP